MGDRVPKRWRWEDRRRPGHEDSSSEDLDGPPDMWRAGDEDEFGDESYRLSMAEQVMERARRGRRHPADPIVALGDGSAVVDASGSRSRDEIDGGFGGESYRPSMSTHVTKEVEEVRRGWRKALYLLQRR